MKNGKNIVVVGEEIMDKYIKLIIVEKKNNDRFKQHKIKFMIVDKKSIK
jgi:hypothetical protein